MREAGTHIPTRKRVCLAPANIPDAPIVSENRFASAEFLRSCARMAQLPDDGLPELAMAGRSNAGKSSALNRLCRRKALARTSKTPGRTQLLNYFSVTGGYLVDLPGYGYANVPLAVRKSWGELVGGYVRDRDALRGIALVMDIRHPLTEHDVQMIGWAIDAGRRIHVLLTKADKLSFGRARGVQLSVQRELGDSASCQLFSATAGTGVEEAQRALGAWLAPDAPPGAKEATEATGK